MKKSFISFLAFAAIGMAGNLMLASCERHNDKVIDVESIDSIKTVFDSRTGRADYYEMYYTDAHGTEQSIELDKYTYMHLDQQAYSGTIVLEYSLFSGAYKYAYTVKEDKVVRFHEPDTVSAEAQPDKEMKRLEMPMYAKFEPKK